MKRRGLAVTLVLVGLGLDAPEDFQAALIDRREGDTVTLKVVRGGRARDVRVTLGASSLR